MNELQGEAARPASQTAGAKERVARLGAHLKMRDDGETGPVTPASAPKVPGGDGRPDAAHSSVTGKYAT